MIRLAHSELRRLVGRRLFRWLGALLVLGIVAGGVINFVRSDRDPATARAAAQQYVAQCEAERRMYAEEFPDEAVDWQCPEPEEMLFAFDRGFRYATEVRTTTRGVATLLLVLAFAVGASFVGAEWGSGSMATLLTWEPRRFRVLAAKLAVCGLVAAAAALLALALLALVHLPAGYVRGYTAGLGMDYWRELSAIWGRSGVLTGIFGLVGAAVAAGIRHTAGALAVGGVYAAIVDPLLLVVREGRLRPWLLIHNVPRFQGYEVLTETVRDQFGGSSSSYEVLPVWRSALLFSIYTVVVMTVTYVTFARRDVT